MKFQVSRWFTASEAQWLVDSIELSGRISNVGKSALAKLCKNDMDIVKAKFAKVKATEAATKNRHQTHIKMVCGIVLDSQTEHQEFEEWVSAQKPEFLEMIEELPVEWKKHKDAVKEAAEAAGRKRKADEGLKTPTKGTAKTPSSTTVATVSPPDKSAVEALLEMEVELAMLRCEQAEVPVSDAARMPTSEEKVKEARMDLLDKKIKLASLKLKQEEEQGSS